MKRISIRDEEVPYDANVVVRGGEMNSDHVRRTATDAYDELGWTQAEHANWLADTLTHAVLPDGTDRTASKPRPRRQPTHSRPTHDPQ